MSLCALGTLHGELRKKRDGHISAFAYRWTKSGHNFSKLSDLADFLRVCSTRRACKNGTKSKSQLLLHAEHWVLKVGRFGGILEGRFFLDFTFSDL